MGGCLPWDSSGRLVLDPKSPEPTIAVPPSELPVHACYRCSTDDTPSDAGVRPI